MVGAARKQQVRVFEPCPRPGNLAALIVDGTAVKIVIISFVDSPGDSALKYGILSSLASSFMNFCEVNEWSAGQYAVGHRLIEAGLLGAPVDELWLFTHVRRIGAEN